MTTFSTLPRRFHVLLVLTLLLIIGMNLVKPMPWLSWLFVPSIALFIGLSAYYLQRSRQKLSILTLLVPTLLMSLSYFVLFPYYRFQQDDFLDNKYTKMCGDEPSPNAPDVIFCSAETSCRINGNRLHLGYNGLDGKPLHGEIVQREWRLTDGGVVHIRFYPYPQINQYCIK